jgi:hypothetical protein
LRLRYPACNARAPYCHLWPVRLYSIFARYLIKCKIFGEKVIEPKMCFNFFYNFVRNVVILRIIERDIIIYVYCIVLHVGYPLFLSNFNHAPILLDIFSKNIKIHEIPSSGSGIVPCGRTDGRTDRQTDEHDEVNSRFFTFFANAPKHTFL